jgi:hypothetical protein
VFQTGPLNFAQRIKNEGNIHEQPTGQVIIKDMFGRKVATLNINLPPRNILPASTRKFEQPLDKTVIGNKRLFGRYTANLTVNYGKNKQSTTSSLTFWVMPYRLIAIVILALIAGCILHWILCKCGYSIYRTRGRVDWFNRHNAGCTA